jgi:Holliday junction resolvasome RuvABC endonuclease subunit
LSLVLCVDVGLANIGAVVVDTLYPFPDARPGQPPLLSHKIVEFAFCHTEKTDKKSRWRYSDDRARRVQEGARFYAELVRRHGATRAAAELPIGGAPNSQAATDLALASTTFVAAMEILGVAVEFYDPKEVKRAVTGKTGASKDQIMNEVALRYPPILDQFPHKAQREHVSDAVGVYLAARHGNLFRL